MNRRALLLSAAAAAFAANAKSEDCRAPIAAPIKGIAFDAFTLFDSRPISEACKRAFPLAGERLSQLWHSTQLQMLWLRALAGQYRNFSDTTELALAASARDLDLALQPRQRQVLMDSYSNMQPWPEVRSVLTALTQAAVRLAVLSDMEEPFRHARLG